MDGQPVIWMWEAAAAPGRAGELRDWALATLGDQDGEVYRSIDQPRDLVVILLREAPDGPGAACPLPNPPAGLVAGKPHAWPFARVRSADSGRGRPD